MYGNLFHGKLFFKKLFLENCRRFSPPAIISHFLPVLFGVIPGLNSLLQWYFATEPDIVTTVSSHASNCSALFWNDANTLTGLFCTGCASVDLLGVCFLDFIFSPLFLLVFQCNSVQYLLLCLQYPRHNRHRHCLQLHI